MIVKFMYKTEQDIHDGGTISIRIIRGESSLGCEKVLYPKYGYELDSMLDLIFDDIKDQFKRKLKENK